MQPPQGNLLISIIIHLRATIAVHSAMSVQALPRVLLAKEAIMSQLEHVSILAANQIAWLAQIQPRALLVMWLPGII